MSETNIVTDVLDVFRASGFEVRESNFGATPETVIYGTADNAGVLMESVLEHFSKATEGADSCAQREKCEVKNLAHAGVTAEPAEIPGEIAIAIPMEVRAALDRMCQPLHESRLSGATAEADARCMDTIKRFIDSLAAPTIPAQVPAAEVRAQALEELKEGAEILGDLIDSIEKHGNYSKTTTLTYLAQVKQCCDTSIRSLAQSGTADKASEVRAAEEGGAA